MKKVSVALLVALLATPALAELYDEDYGTYDDEEYGTYDDESYSVSAPAKSMGLARDTYAGFRIHRNEYITYRYSINGDHLTTVRDNNFGLGLNIGNRLTDNIKIEFETLYTGKHANKHATDFDYDVWSNMLNVYMYKTYGGAVEPYLGLGLGLTGIWSDIDGALGKSHDIDFDLSFAVMGGVNFALNEYIDLNLGLRYIDYGDAKHKHSTTKIDATEIYIGAAYKFSIFKK